MSDEGPEPDYGDGSYLNYLWRTACESVADPSATLGNALKGGGAEGSRALQQLRWGLDGLWRSRKQAKKRARRRERKQREREAAARELELIEAHRKLHTSADAADRSARCIA